MADPPLFTVFTATYNRAHTIHRVFDSLREQTCRDFEWLVIDDGSADNTAELIATWIKVADFPVRYVKQDNGGKHLAHNRALVEARGQFFATVDSDDALVSDALEKLVHLWNSIPRCERHAFCSIGAHCCDQAGNLIGDRFPTDPFDADNRELRYVHRVGGEKWIVWVTEILRRHPFPEIAGTQEIPGGRVWFEIAKNFKGRWLNEMLRIYYIDDPATGATLTRRKTLTVNAPGRLCYYIWSLNNDLGYFFYSPLPFLKAAVMLPILARASNQSLGHVLQSLNTVQAKGLVLLGLPLAVLVDICGRLTQFRNSEVVSGSPHPET